MEAFHIINIPIFLNYNIKKYKKSIKTNWNINKFIKKSKALKISTISRILISILKRVAYQLEIFNAWMNNKRYLTPPKGLEEEIWVKLKIQKIYFAHKISINEKYI